MKTLVYLVLDIMLLAAIAAAAIVIYQVLVTEGIIEPLFQSSNMTEVYLRMGVEELKDSAEYFKLMLGSLLG